MIKFEPDVSAPAEASDGLENSQGTGKRQGAGVITNFRRIIIGAALSASSPGAGRNRPRAVVLASSGSSAFRVSPAIAWNSCASEPPMSSEPWSRSSRRPAAGHRALTARSPPGYALETRRLWRLEACIPLRLDADTWPPAPEQPLPPAGHQRGRPHLRRTAHNHSRSTRERPRRQPSVPGAGPPGSQRSCIQPGTSR